MIVKMFSVSQLVLWLQESMLDSNKHIGYRYAKEGKTLAIRIGGA